MDKRFYQNRSRDKSFLTRQAKDRQKHLDRSRNQDKISSQKLGAEKTNYSNEFRPKVPLSPNDQCSQTTLPPNIEKMQDESPSHLVEYRAILQNYSDLLKKQANLLNKEKELLASQIEKNRLFLKESLSRETWMNTPKNTNHLEQLRHSLRGSIKLKHLELEKIESTQKKLNQVWKNYFDRLRQDDKQREWLNVSHLLENTIKENKDEINKLKLLDKTTENKITIIINKIDAFIQKNASEKERNDKINLLVLQNEKIPKYGVGILRDIQRSKEQEDCINQLAEWESHLSDRVEKLNRDRNSESIHQIRELLDNWTKKDEVLHSLKLQIIISNYPEHPKEDSHIFKEMYNTIQETYNNYMEKAPSSRLPSELKRQEASQQQLNQDTLFQQLHISTPHAEGTI